MNAQGPGQSPEPPRPPRMSAKEYARQHTHAAAPGFAPMLTDGQDEYRAAAGQSAEALADPEVVAADHGHWAAGAFPDSLDETKTHLVCECGMPWTPGEGCLFVQGIRAQRLATPPAQLGASS